jgi:hypothetical protein
MNKEIVLISIFIFAIVLVGKAVEILKVLYMPNERKTPFDMSPHKYMDYVNDFIRREAKIELSKWILNSQNIRSAATNDTTLFQQLTNGEIIKGKVSTITNVIAEKMSPDLQTAFNRVYKRELQEVDNKTSIDITLREYVGRYVYFLTRRIVYDLTVLINSEEFGEKTLTDILGPYIKSLEESIYEDNEIYLINYDRNNSNKDRSITDNQN